MIELRPLDELDPLAVQARQAVVLQQVSDDNPRLDLRLGVFNELLVYYHAALDEQRATNIQDYWNARSLEQIIADPALADEDLVSGVLSNFGVTRQPGVVATGEVVVVVSSNVTVTIAQGSLWDGGGQQFVAPRSYTAKIEEGQVVLPGDRLIESIGDGRYAFTITLDAVEVGPAGNIRKDTQVVPRVAPPNYLTSYAASDFLQGVTTESNAELVERQQEGIAAKTVSNRINMAAMLRATEEFARLVATSIIGFGDAEMLRDKHGIFPVANGGRCDWYVRTQESLARVKLTKTATLVDRDSDSHGIWQFGVARDEAPGVYEFTDIRLTGVVAQGGYEVTADVRSYDLGTDAFAPDITTAEEGAYSRYSSATVQFRDTDTALDLALGATRDYDVYATVLPLIADIQALMLDRDHRSYGADCLVKAPVPCFVALNMIVHKRTGEDDPDLDTIKTDLTRAVNSVGFVGRLFGSKLAAVVQGHLSANQTVSSLDMLGRLRYASGEVVYLRSGDVLQVPEAPTSMVSARTVQFFVDPEAIAITVTTSVP